MLQLATSLLDIDAADGGIVEPPVRVRIGPKSGAEALAKRPGSSASKGRPGSSASKGSPGSSAILSTPPPKPASKQVSALPPKTVAAAKRMLASRQLTTFRNHVSRAEKLMDALNTRDVADLFDRTDEVVRYVERPGGYTSSSRMSFYSSLSALLNPEKPIADMISGAVGASKTRAARSLYLTRNGYWSRKVSEKQLRLTKTSRPAPEGGSVAFRTILEAYRKARPSMSTDDRLLADMYLAAPDDPAGAVRRANYGCCWVLASEPDAEGLPQKTNYVVVPPEGRKPVTMVLNSYKTARSHGEYRTDLPPVLSRSVRASLEETPRPLLFYTSRSPGEYQCLNGNAFAKRVSSVMRSVTGRAVGINQLRRSYSSYLIEKGLSPEALERFAEGMNSSVSILKNVYKRRYLIDESKRSRKVSGARKRAKRAPNHREK